MSDTPHATDQSLLCGLPDDIDWARLIPRYDEGISHPNCIIIAPFRKTSGDPTIMATVEHYAKNANPGGFPWTILPVTQQPLPLRTAVAEAFRFAKTNKIAVIYLNQDGFSSDAELRQTDTKALKTGVPSAR